MFNSISPPTHLQLSINYYGLLCDLYTIGDSVVDGELL